jgi:hypothetical protein
MALLAPQQAAYPSFAPVYSAASAGGDTCMPADNTRLVVKNGSGAPINVTISSFPNTNEWGATIADLVVAVPAAGERWIGPFRGPAHADPVTGLVSISYSSATTVTVGLVAVP